VEVRLQKVIAASGLASRRKAEQLIAQGRVTVNGHIICELGTKVDPDQDHVKVDGRHLGAVEPHAYVILNKPKGYVSSLSDPEGRPTIKDLLHGVHVRVFPVGRLDFDTEGALLLTNHGEMAQALLHPRYHVPKVYLVKVKGVLTDEEIRHLEDGVRLEDGLTGPAVVKKIKKAEENSWIELTIHEGRTHQVKRMLEAVGHPVLRLKRIKFGPLMLGDLPSGEFRYLTDREANALRNVFKSRESVARASVSDLSRSARIRPIRPASSSLPSRSLPDRARRSSRDTGSFPDRSRRTRPPAAGQDRLFPKDDARPQRSRPDAPRRSSSRLSDTGQVRPSAEGRRSFGRTPARAERVRSPSQPGLGRDQLGSRGTRSVQGTPARPERRISPSRPRAGRDQLPSRGTRSFPNTPAHPKRVSSPSRPRSGQDQLASRGTRSFPGTPGRPRGYRPGAPSGADRRQSRGPRPFPGRSRPPGRGKSPRSPIKSRPRVRRRP
jgi:23S rRNA pseudouridine2605 synthase